MIYKGANNNVVLPNVNDELGNLEGFLSEEEARVTFTKFLRYNIGVTVDFLTGKELYPLQRMMIRGMFLKDFFLAIMSRGLSKSWSAAVFCFLYAIFNPGSKIGIISGSFRQAQIIFRYIEEMANSPQGILLKQCFLNEPSHKNDIWRLEIGTSQICCLPLGNAEKLRGFRFNVVVIDELLLLPENIIKEVILPFLSVNFDPVKREKTSKIEDALVKKGLLKEEERTVFSNPKFIGLSSASYQFEYLYKMYKGYMEKIYDPSCEEGRHYGIMQLSYEALSHTKLYNPSFLEEMRNSLSAAQFNREFNSVFTDDSGGYFSQKKMELCTISAGQEPTVEIEGDSNSKYILAIDPSWSNSESSDHYAATIVKLDEQNKTGTVVHNYAVAGGKMQDHMKYLRYLLTRFNIVFLIIDSAGSWFLDDANLSTIFKEANLEVNFIEGDLFSDNYAVELNKAKRSYSLETKKIAYQQYFTANWIRRANEMLAAAFDHKKIFFGSPVIGEKYEKYKKSTIPLNDLNYGGNADLDGMAKLAEFIDHQYSLIKLVKRETALIELTTDASSITQKFRLPSNVRNSNAPDRARKDNYTTLLLANYGMLRYFDIIFAPTEKKESFIPFFLR